ncbi:MAG: pilin [Patescibacteria group bacterium]
MNIKLKKVLFFLAGFAIMSLPFALSGNFQGDSLLPEAQAQGDWTPSGFDPDEAKDSSLSDMTPSEIFETIIGWLLAILAFLAVLGIIISGIMYVVGGGSTKESAKGWLMYSIIGLVIALLGYVIVNVITQLLSAGT